ncbi:hypothetical protein ACVWYN_000084 [Pedobacter sp. UYP24]
MNQNCTMANYAFSQSGVDALLQEIYQLPKFELKAEAESMLLNFQEWMAARFDLKPSQLNFVKNLNAETLALTATACSFALANQLPIYLEKQVKETTNPETDPFKTLKTSSNLKSSSANDGSWVVSGYVTVSIGYGKD